MWKSLKNSTKTVCRNLFITDSYDIRRYLAILFMAGGSIAMTLLLVYITILIGPANPGLLFWIALGCMTLIGVQQTGFVSLIAKRSIIVTRDKVEIADKDVKVI